MAADNTNVKTIVDWTKLTWNVDGEGSTTHQFSISDVATAVVNAAGTVLTVTLSAEGQDNLHSLEGFGGTAGTGGTKDALQVAARLYERQCRKFIDGNLNGGDRSYFR